MVDSVNHIKWQECQSLIYVYNPNKNIIKKDQDKTNNQDWANKGKRENKLKSKSSKDEI